MSTLFHLLALRRVAQDYPKAREILKEGWITHKFTPFDPVSKRITAEVEWSAFFALYFRSL
jgi:predicted esterase YcpF (UPF0227 family)